MAKVLEAGKAKVVLAFIVVGVLAVAGTLIIVFNYTDSNAPEDPGTTKAENTPANVISDAEDPILAGNKVAAGDEEEKPVLIRTVDESGNTTWIDTREVDIYRPGKGSIKAMKIASATGRKMKKMEVEPEPAKTVSVHPSQIRKKKGKVNKQGNTGGDGSGEGGKEGDSTKGGGKVGEGKGAGGGG